MQSLNLDFGERSYSIHIGPQLLEQPNLILPQLSGKQLLIISNTTVAPLYLEKLKASLSQAKPELIIKTCILPDGEAYKNLENLQKVWDTLLKEGFNRKATLLALGGGVVGDMTGFAAAKPVISPTTPPPRASSVALRLKPSLSSVSQTFCRFSRFL